MNKCFFVARTTKEPELKYSSKDSSLAVVRVGLAVPRFKSKDCDFINCVVFGKTAEAFAKYIHKGERVAIVSHLQIDKTDKGTYYSFIVDEWEFADGKKETKPEDEGFTPMEDSQGDDELPFV